MMTWNSLHSLRITGVLSISFFGFLPDHSLRMSNPNSVGNGGSNRHYKWVQAIEQGKGMGEEHWKVGAWPITYAHAIVLNGTMFMIGRNFTWTSQDGKHWDGMQHNGRWGERYGSAHVMFAGKFWMMGGMKSWDRFTNDVWSSPDGIRWTLVTARAPWSERRGHAALVHDGKLWVIGGAESSGRPNVLPTRSLGDVWSSKDGITWECITGEGPWSAEFSRTFFSTSISGHVFDGKLWVIGSPGYSTVWHSVDGLKWTMATKQVSWKGRYARGSAVYDNLLWVFGGENLNDVWYSRNGAEWKELTPHAPWSPRAPYTTVVFKDRLWMYGGKTGRSNDRGDDVWCLEASNASR